MFEKSGLVFDKERVLTYSKLLCPLDCRYCFVENLASSNQKEKVSYLSNEQVELLGNLPEETNLIMLGCDTEFFQNREDALALLHRLADLRKDVSAITKLAIPSRYIEQLSLIVDKLREQRNIFSLSISIPCLESSKFWEPGAPRPERRIKVLREAFSKGINTFVAMRPLLPTISDEEIRHIVEVTKDSAIGYYSGPLYLKDLDPELIPEDIRGSLAIEHVQPHWMPAGNLFYKIERPGQMDYLRKLISDKGKFMFDGAAEANEFLKNHEEYRNKSSRGR